MKKYTAWRTMGNHDQKWAIPKMGRMSPEGPFKPHRAEAFTVMVGTHLLLDGFGCVPERMTDAEGGAVALTEAAQAAHMTPLSAPVVHIFPGGGYTALLPLAESHLSIHTYPERGLFCADLFTCGPAADPDAAVAVLRAALAPKELRITRVDRGETK